MFLLTGSGIRMVATLGMRSGSLHQTTTWKRRKSSRAKVTGVGYGHAQASPRMRSAVSADQAWEGMPLSSTNTRNCIESASAEETRLHLLNRRTMSAVGGGGA